MVTLSSSPPQASAATVRSTMQAATAPTGRVRSTGATRAARMNWTSIRAMCAGPSTVIGAMDGLFAQYASRIYPRVRLFTTSPCKSLDLRGEFFIFLFLLVSMLVFKYPFGKGSVSLRKTIFLLTYKLDLCVKNIKSNL